MEAEERPTKFPRLDTAEGTNSALSPPQDASIAASIPGLPRSEAEGTHATGLKESGKSQGLSDSASTKPGVPTDGSLANLSKSARKKLLKKQAWEAARPARKAARKERIAARKEQARTARAEAHAAGDDVSSLPVPSSSTRGNRNRNAASKTPLPVGIVLDCGFDELMTEKEMVSLCSQVTRCYSENANAAPAHARLVVAGLDGRLKERFETVFKNTHLKWRGIEVRTDGLSEVLKDMTFNTDSAKVAASSALGLAAAAASTDETNPTTNPWAANITDSPSPSPNADGSFPVARTVYLTADADETLTELKPYETYVVGALVDRNRHKGICRRRAEELGIATAKLPIGEYLRMASRQVLATNHVVEIMLYWLRGEGWAKALERVMPKRKRAVMKGQQGQEDAQGGEENGGKEEEEGSERDEDHAIAATGDTRDPVAPSNDAQASTTA